MSKFSGKCDFFDMIEIHGEENVLKSDVYISGNVVPMNFKSRKDLIPYYPYIVSMSATSHGIGTIILSEKSYVDSSEEERLDFYLDFAKKLYRKCKRKGLNYKKESEKYLSSWCNNAEREIFNLVGQYGEKANVDGVHIDFSEHYRKELYDEMVNAGWRKWVAYYWVYKDFSKALSMVMEQDEFELDSDATFVITLPPEEEE